MKPIFHIEDRGNVFIFHWFIYMVSGFRFLGTKQSLNGPDGSGSISQNDDNVVLDLCEPLQLCISNLTKSSYVLETFELLKDKFKLIDKQDINPEDVVVNNYGEFILNTDYYISPDGYNYVRELFLNRIVPKGNYKGKRYYLCRSKSHLLEGNAKDGNIKRRHIINEDLLTRCLQLYNIKPIFLEDFNLEEKINIFNEAELIISPNSGGLTFTLFSNPSTTIVEINSPFTDQISRQYLDQCKYFKVPYYKYNCFNSDGCDNMNIDVQDFLKFLSYYKIIK